MASYVIAQQFEPLKAKVTVQVFDEAGKPFPNADVQIGFDDPKTRLAVYSKGKTDMHGLFTAEGVCDGMMGGSIKKDGYYDSGFPFKITGEKDGKWLPWNPICKTTLRPIGKPVALYAKTVHLEIPELDKPCGFDLVTSDWVAPYGKGKEQDLIFKLIQDYHGIQNYDLRGELTFNNPLDGVQESSIPDIGKYSEFKWERQAPENGYNQKQELRNAWFPDGSGKKPIQSFKTQDIVINWDGYFFRVRTMEQDGKIVSAHYGKILGGVMVYPGRKTGKPKIDFTYYFNPTSNDRNLEWDTKKNLFSGLNNDETPHPSWWP
jgi:hypothetical protein